jgi:hypothetical protein
VSKKTKRRPSGEAPGTLIERMMGSLWRAVAAGDLLHAELEAATCMALPRVGQMTPEDVQAFISKVLVDEAVRESSPDGAAMLRLVMSLGSPATKRAASRGLGELTEADIYPPDWVTEVGRAVPVQAWRRYDVFGDVEAIAVTFRYGEPAAAGGQINAEHGVVGQVDLTGIPVVIGIGVTADGAGLIEAMSQDDDPFERMEQIGLAEARRGLETPLARCDEQGDPGLTVQTLAYLPVARSRVRRLPAEGASPVPVFTAADRAAAVDDFLKSPLAAEAVAADEDATRFWAEVLTGYSSRIPGEPPGQVGPGKIAHILLGHVPNTFSLSAAQRQHLEPAVTAWIRWSAEHRGLDEAATARLTESLPTVFGRFGEAYDDPDAATARSYVADLAVGDADVSALAEHVARRMFALRMPRLTKDGGPVDVSDPAFRRELIEAEFAECTPHAGLTREEFMAAVHRVVAELWDDDPAETFAAARRMFTAGADRHDIIHTLAEKRLSATRPGPPPQAARPTPRRGGRGPWCRRARAGGRSR